MGLFFLRPVVGHRVVVLPRRRAFALFHIAALFQVLDVGGVVLVPPGVGCILALILQLHMVLNVLPHIERYFFGAVAVQVVAAGAADLQQVPGVGEQTAVQILLVRDLNRRIRQNQNKPVKHLTDAARSCAYFANLLRDKTTEQVYLVTLDGSAKILQTHAVGSGSVNLASVDQRTLMEHILRDNANAVMLAHNHPGGKAQPSAQDLEFTIRLLSILRSIHVQLLDHIIVSPTNTYSMRSDPEYGSFFTVK